MTNLARTFNVHFPPGRWLEVERKINLSRKSSSDLGSEEARCHASRPSPKLHVRISRSSRLTLVNLAVNL